MYSFKNLKSPINTGSGIADYVLLAPVEWFTSIKSPSAAILPGDEVLIKQTHTFLSGKGFVKYALAPEKNSFDAKTIGEKGFQKFDQDLKIFIPGSYAELHEAAHNWMNVPLIALAKDSNCGADIWYQLGSECVYANMTIDFSTGTTKDGIKGYTATINYSANAVYLYVGNILLFGDITPPAPVPLSVLFMAPLSVNELSGNLAAMAAAFAGAFLTDITDMYNAIVAAADAGVIQIYLINDDADQVSDYLTTVDLTSEDSFLDSIENWLLDFGSGQQLIITLDNELGLIDSGATQSYLGVAVPQNLLGGGTYIFSANASNLISA